MSTNFGNMKFHENPFRGSRAVPCRQTDWLSDWQTDKTKLVSTFRNCFAKTLIQLDDEISTRHVDNDCGFVGPYSAQPVPHTGCIWRYLFEYFMKYNSSAWDKNVRAP